MVKPLALAPPVQDTIAHYDVLLLTHNIIVSKVRWLPPVRKFELCVSQTQEDCDDTIGVKGVTLGVTQTENIWDVRAR